METTLEIFIYDTLKAGSNNLSSTEFYAIGIPKKITSKALIRQGMEARVEMIKICKVTGTKQKTNYETFKWDDIEKIPS